MLLLERQLLKRRVKRDFLELNHGRSQSNAKQQQVSTRPNQQLQPQMQMQLLLPNSNSNSNFSRPAYHQYSRPANQPVSPARPSQQQLKPSARLQQPTFLRPPFGFRDHWEEGVAGGHEPLEASGSSLSALHYQTRPSPHDGHQPSNSSGKHQPFNDPSWPLMWYLVSIIHRATFDRLCLKPASVSSNQLLLMLSHSHERSDCGQLLEIGAHILIYGLSKFANHWPDSCSFHFRSAGIGSSCVICQNRVQRLASCRVVFHSLRVGRRKISSHFRANNISIDEANSKIDRIDRCEFTSISSVLCSVDELERD